MIQNRAWRLINIIDTHSEKSKNVANLIGIDNPSTWRSALRNVSVKQSDFLYKSLGRLLEKYPHVQERNELMSQIECGNKNESMLILILMALARGSGDDSTRPVMCRCNQLSSMLGDLGSEPLFKEMISKAISTLSNVMMNAENDNELQLGVRVLDWTLGLDISKIDSTNTSKSSEVVSEKVEVGDELWYIVDSSKEDSERVKVTIETIHTDDYPNLYFTVKVGDTSRQTIPSRLRYEPLPSKQALHKHIPWIEETIASRLVKPHFLSETQEVNEIAAECLNIVISYCGLSGNAGIGSTRYDLFQLLTKLGQEILQQLNSEQLSLLALSLKRLSLALGYGVYTTSSKDNAAIIRYPCDELMSTLLDFYESEKGVLLTEAKAASLLNPSIIMWLTVASNSSLNESNAAQIWSLATTIVSEASEQEFHQNCQAWLNMTMKVYKSMKSASIGLSQDCTAVTMDAEQSIMSNLVQAFVKCEVVNVNEEVVHSISVVKPSWLQKFQSFAFQCMENQSSAAISFGARQQIEGLCECLLSPEKQWCAFQLLSKATKRDYQLYKKDDNLDPSTCKRLDEWLKGYDEDENSEIEEDVLVTGTWMPRRLMKALEEFGEEEIDDIDYDEAALTGKLLQWLICLEFLDAAASSDMRNRTHIGSYVKLTGAIKFVVENALQYATLETRKEADWFRCMSIDNDSNEIPLPQLSTLVLFRSVETVPTLFKSWWNEDCPRSMQNLVNTFVEAMVAPATLRRELDRIRIATNLDEMSVSGSCVSREVVASYVQDEVSQRQSDTFLFTNVY